MQDPQFIYSLQDRFKSALATTLHSQTMIDRLQIIQKFPTIRNIPDALSYFYASEEKRYEIKTQIRNGFLKLLSKEDLLKIYTPLLLSALEKALLSIKNISYLELEELKKDLPAANAQFLNCLTKVFLQELNNSENCLDDIHLKIIDALLNEYASSSFFNFCDADIPSALREVLNQEFESLEGDMHDVIMAPVIQEEYAENLVMSDGTFAAMYNCERKNQASRDMLPLWTVSEDDDDEKSIAEMRPEIILCHFEQEFKKHASKLNVYSKFAEVFSAKYSETFANCFNEGIGGYANLVATAHLHFDPLRRAKLCKTNTIIALHYDKCLDKAAKDFANKIFKQYVESNPAEQRQWLFICQSEFTNPLASRLKDGMQRGKGLSATFNWPAERAVQNMPKISNGPKF